MVHPLGAEYTRSIEPARARTAEIIRDYFLGQTNRDAYLFRFGRQLDRLAGLTVLSPSTLRWGLSAVQ